MRKPKYECPFCKKPLSKKEWEAALQLTAEQHQQQQEAIEQARKQARDAERAKTAVWAKKAKALRHQLRLAERGKTPQAAGLEDQHKMVARLQRQFEPLGDKVIEKGQGGDVLHTVVYEDKAAGLIVYECKNHTDPGKRISSGDIQQAADAKQSRGADFAVLVTTGKRKDFGGYQQIDGVLVCGPLCALPLADLIRLHLVAMAKANLTRKQRAQVAQKLLDYITSPEFAHRIEDAAQAGRELEDVLDNEVEAHFKIWGKRSNLYQRIQWDMAQIQANVDLALQGKEPRTGQLPKRSQRQLRAPIKGVR